MNNILSFFLTTFLIGILPNTKSLTDFEIGYMESNLFKIGNFDFQKDDDLSIFEDLIDKEENKINPESNNVNEKSNLFAPILKFLVIAFFAFIIANYIGKYRKIGIGWSFILSIFLTPLIGIFITIVSPINKKEIQKKSKLKLIIGWIIIIWSIFGFFGTLHMNKSKEIIIPIIGLILFGNYMIELGKGKILNDKYYIKQID